MLCLNISSQNAKLSINTTRTIFNLKITNPQIQIDSEPAKLDIRQAKGELEIDNTPYRYSIGIKNIQDMARDNAQAGRQTALETIRRIAEEGDRLANIANGGNPIADIAAESNVAEAPEITWAYIEPPSINYKVIPAQISVIPGKLDIDLQRGTVNSNLERGTVDIRVAQYQSIKFWTTENKYDMRA